MSKADSEMEEELKKLREKLHEQEELTTHLREQLLATHADRVKIQGYLYQFRPFPNSFFSSPWEIRYFCLVDTHLKCFRSEKKMALIPETELPINGCTVEREGLKREKFWTFGLKDSAGCLVIRLSSTNRTFAEQWISILETTIGCATTLQKVNSLPNEKVMSEARDNYHVNKFDKLKADSEKSEKRKVMIGSTPVHQQSKSSILTSERLFEHPHPGLLNLGAVILIAANFRLVLENVFKYGLRINPISWLQQFLWGSSQPLILCWPVLGICCAFTFSLEKLMANHMLSVQTISKKNDHKLPRNISGTTFLVIGHTLNAILCFLIPLWLVYISEEALLPSVVLTMMTVIVFMKLISFVHCNADLRMARLHNELRPGERESYQEIQNADKQLKYPENITVVNFAYFLAAPTLTYQPSYPRSTRVRRKWIARRCGELIIALALLMAIVDQYIIPAVDNSMIPIEKRNFIALVERVLKLSLPVIYAWITMFYMFFHLWLNILAESLRFGDREFYSDWWNALNVGDYWKMWNTPVHKWMLRTLYYPIIHSGLSRSTAMLIVFFVSALVHEVVVIIPLKFTSTFPWLFVGMLMQVPLIFFTQFLQKNIGDRWGNIIFWVSFCVLGQPICLLYYYYDWIHANTPL